MSSRPFHFVDSSVQGAQPVVCGAADMDAWSVRHPKYCDALQRVRDDHSIKLVTLPVGVGRALSFKIRNNLGHPILHVRAWIIGPKGYARVDGKRSFMSVAVADAGLVEIIELPGGLARIAHGGRSIRFPAMYIPGVRRAFLFCLRRMIRHPLLVAFSFPQAMSPMGGNGGSTFGCAGIRRRQSSNPAICCPPSFGSDAGRSTVYGGHDMAALPIPARSAHIFPITEKAARRAARQWFAGAPTMTLANWRDEARQRHCVGLPADPKRIEAFNAAFASELAAIIAGGSSNRKAGGRQPRASLAVPIERAVSAFGYTNGHPEDAQGIEHTYKALVAVIIAVRATMSKPRPDVAATPAHTDTGNITFERPRFNVAFTKSCLFFVEAKYDATWGVKRRLAMSVLVMSSKEMERSFAALIREGNEDAILDLAEQVVEYRDHLKAVLNLVERASIRLLAVAEYLSGESK